MVRTPFHARLDSHAHYHALHSHMRHDHRVHIVTGHGFGKWARHAFHSVSSALAPVAKEALGAAAQAAVSHYTGQSTGNLGDNLRNAAMSAGASAIQHEASGMGGSRGPARPSAGGPGAPAGVPLGVGGGEIAGFGVKRKRKPAKRKPAKRPY